MCAKNHSREIKIWFKQKTRRKMNYQQIAKIINEKNPIEKIEKTVKRKMKLPHVNKKKPLARNENLIQTKNQAQNEL